MKIVIEIPEGLYEAYKGRPPRLGDSGMDMIAQAIANGTPLDNIRAKIKDQIDYHDEEHRKYDSEEEFGISLGLELALGIINKELTKND